MVNATTLWLAQVHITWMASLNTALVMDSYYAPSSSSTMASGNKYIFLALCYMPCCQHLHQLLLWSIWHSHNSTGRIYQHVPIHVPAFTICTPEDAPFMYLKSISHASSKWGPCTWLGVYVSHSSIHSSNIVLVYNITTGHTTLQFHVVFNDHFQTVSPHLSSLLTATINDLFETLWQNNQWTYNDISPEYLFQETIDLPTDKAAHNDQDDGIRLTLTYATACSLALAMSIKDHLIIGMRTFYHNMLETKSPIL